MKAYRKIIDKVLTEGTEVPNRTGINTLSYTGTNFRHDMKNGFPLMTSKRVPMKVVCAELEGFIHGITDKQWYKDRNCNIWNEWCNPQVVPYGKDPITKAKMLEENDLGPIYGAQGRRWHCPDGRVIDQFQNMIDTLKNTTGDRRTIVNYWNPADLDKQALPPCHTGYQLITNGEYLDLSFNMRSVDVGLGMPFDIAHYAMLLTLIAKETNLVPRILYGSFTDTHIYMNHLEGINELCSRELRTLPTIEIPNFDSIFNWKYDQFILHNYNPYKSIKMEIAV